MSLHYIRQILDGQLEKNIDPFTIAALGVSAGTAVAGIIQGDKTARDAQKKIDGYERQDLTNLAANQKINTEANDFKAQQYDQGFANALDVLQNSGSFGNVASLLNQQTNAKREIANDIQSQRNRLDDKILQENQTIRGIQEGRENQELQGLGSQFAYGKQQQQQGYGALASTAISGLSSAANANTGDPASSTATPNQNTGVVSDSNTYYAPQEGTPEYDMWKQYYG